jgi:hypothetical protein
MELEQKSTEVKFEVDEYFLEKIGEFEPNDALNIADSVDELGYIKHTYGDTISGFINNDKGLPVFFTISYYKDEEGPMVLVDINRIDLDEYLDAIDLKKYMGC